MLLVVVRNGHPHCHAYPPAPIPSSASTTFHAAAVAPSRFTPSGKFSHHHRRMFGGLMAHLGRARKQLDHDQVCARIRKRLAM